MTESVIRTRCEESLKKAFEQCCKANDQTASQVMRALMRDYVKKNGQKDMFR